MSLDNKEWNGSHLSPYTDIDRIHESFNKMSIVWIPENSRHTKRSSSLVVDPSNRKTQKIIRTLVKQFGEPYRNQIWRRTH